MNRSRPDLACTRFARMRSAQGRALLAGALLYALVSGEPLRNAGSDALPSVDSAPSAAAAAAKLRPWIVHKLQVHNPRLGTSRSERIADAVLRCTQTQKLPQLTPQLVLAVMLQESDARPGVTSAKGAVGLMQVMPYVYYELLDLPGSIGHLESNVEAGCLVLADNIRRLGVRAGVSSYFWGSTVVSDTYVKGMETILHDLDANPNGAGSSG